MHHSGNFRVSVTKDDLVFASAHFITLAGHRCEGLHGHNYRARVTLDGELDAAGPQRVAAIEMEVEENAGQTAVYRVVLRER